jgi:ATP-dependent RNA helicase DeaD
MDKPTFQGLGLSPEILRAVAALGFEEPSPIQAQAIPPLLEGRDLVGQSRTGSGKTAAFVLPALENLDLSTRVPQVLIVCPTRELAAQVADEVFKLGSGFKGLHAVPIYGGASYERQFHELSKGTHVVIGTPGRLLDHLDRGTLSLEDIDMVVLDEADRMLDLGFREEIERLLSATPNDRQTVFFSATVSTGIRQLIDKYADDPISIKIEEKELTVPTVEQLYFEVPGREKTAALQRIIDFHGYKLGIVFCNTQRMVDELADRMSAQGFSVDRLHGGMAQAQRTRVMNKFKKAEFEFLVATDVAARGIDIDHLEVVVNYDLPYDPEDYVHRIGRTGRAGRHGVAVTFIGRREIFKLQHIERFTKTRIRHATLPTWSEVQEKRAGLLMENAREAVRDGKFQSWINPVEILLEEGLLPTELAAGLFALLAEKQGSTPTESPSFDKPSPASKSPRPPADDFEQTERKPRRTKEKAEPSLRSHDGLRVRLDVGKQHGVGPREIVGLIEVAYGIPHHGVGPIKLDRNESWAEIKTDFADTVQQAAKVETDAGPVHLRPASASDNPPRLFRRPPEGKPRRTSNQRPGGAGKFQRKSRAR